MRRLPPIECFIFLSKKSTSQGIFPKVCMPILPYANHWLFPACIKHLSIPQYLASAPMWDEDSSEKNVLQAMIHCQRYHDASQLCKELLPGIDSLYLEAETAWRSGNLTASLEYLQASREAIREVSKCAELQKLVASLADLETACQDAIERGGILLLEYMVLQIGTSHKTCNESQPQIKLVNCFWMRSKLKKR